MAWRIADSIIKGEISNVRAGRVTGRIWLLGRKEPVSLELDGNFLRDMAGCTLFFQNADPKPGDDVDLAALQKGHVGDMTASRKVYVLDVPVEEAVRLGKGGKDIPRHCANCLYVEWFSELNGRVVIESTDFQVRLSEPAWQMNENDLHRQVEENHAAFRDWLDRLSEEADNEEEEPREDVVPDNRPLNEFEWERLLKESDRNAERLGEVMERYDGHPDSEKLIAREMGWTWLEEEIEAQERGILDPSDQEEESGSEDETEELVPNPLTEGVDWVRDEEGDIHHPLALRAMKLGMRMWHCSEEMKSGNEAADKSIQDMVLRAQITAAKLAGVLNGLAYDLDVDSGFVVAGLKRALDHLHKTIDILESVNGRKEMDEGLLDGFRRDLFAIRQDILRLMAEFRGRV